MGELKYEASDLSVEELSRRAGLVVVQFGAKWCGYCQSMDPYIEGALGGVENLTRFWIEDGPGRRLGRHFRVKLWPTLIFLRDGHEVGRVVRPNDVSEVSKVLASNKALSGT